MSQKIFLSLLLCTAALFGNYENQLIDKIEISVEREANIAPDQIKAKMTTREGDFFSQSGFDKDLKVLSQDFDRVEPQVTLTGDTLQITLKVWPKLTIGRICYEGNRMVSSSTLHGELGISSGALFDRTEFNRAFHKLKAYYVKNGYFEAELEYRVDQDSQSGLVEITICINEGRSGKIKKICFNGFTKREQTDLLNCICTKEYNLFLSWLTGTGNYQEEAIFQDRFTILNYLQNKGYADAQVDIAVVEARGKNRINVIITAEKGCRYYFGDVAFEGNTLFTDEQIRCQIKALQGCPYSPDILNDSVRNLMNLYGRSGYIEAYVNYIPRLDDATNTFSINFSIEEGDPYCVGLIKIYGNCTTQTKVILHETLLSPGDVFNSQKLQKTEARLKNIGYFKNVNVYPVKAGGASALPGNYRDVHIEVEETSTGHLGAFFGLSSIQDIFGGVNITERNFNICGMNRLFCDGYQALRGGGEYAHISTSVGSKSLSYNLSWTKPYFMDTPWTLGVDLERSSNRYISDDYTLRTTGGTLSLSYQYNAFTRAGLHYRIRYSDDDVKHHKLKTEESSSIKEREKADGVGLTSAVGGYWFYDSTNHPLKPTCGLRSRFEEEIAGVGGDVFFVSLAYLNKWYFNLWDCAVLKARFDLRFIQPFNGQEFNHFPLDERLFLGGDSTIRGYRPYRPGPKLDGHGDEPAGGLSLQFYSVEISRPFFSRMDGFVFCDAGYLSKKQWRIDEPWVSAGFGIRFELMENSPPIEAGLGFPLNPRGSTNVKKFFFQMGGRF